MAKKITRVVVVGGGFGGVKTALNLANKACFEVTLVSNNTHFEYHGALYRSAVGHSPMEVVIPLREIFSEAHNVTLALDTAAYIDAKKQLLVSMEGEIYPYDELVLALGNQVNYFGIKGLAEHTESMHDISSTIKLRKRLVDMFSRSVSKPLRVVIVGAGASGVELAGEIPAFSRLVAKKYGIKPVRVKTVLVDAADRVLPMLAPKASLKTHRHLQKLGVEIHLGVQVAACKSDALCMKSGELEADVIVWTAGSKPVDFYSKNSEIFTLGRGGRVVVDDHLRAQGQSHIYTLGDNADTQYSGMAQTALHDANFVSSNLIREQAGKTPAAYRNRKPLYVVTAGPQWAVVQRGKQILSGKRGWAVRRQADLMIFRNFQPYKEAIKTWRHAYRIAKF